MKVYLRERKNTAKARKSAESLDIRPTFKVGFCLGIRRFTFTPVKAGKSLKVM
jgi:hypothetical protein